MYSKYAYSNLLLLALPINKIKGSAIIIQSLITRLTCLDQKPLLAKRWGIAHGLGGQPHH
jgi:hypothetical protein